MFKIKDLNRTVSEKAGLIAAASMLLLYFLLQAGTLRNPPWEVYETWRQSDTYSIAVNFAQIDMNILKPQFNYDGPSGNVVQLELQLVPFLSALIFKLTGVMTPLVPRVIGLLLFMGSAIFVFRIARRFTGSGAALLGLAVYLLLPITLLYSRAVMPEPCALFFLCGGVFYLLEWDRSGRSSLLWLSAVYIAFAIMEKAPLVFAGILVISVFIWKYGGKVFKQGKFFGYGAVALLVPVAYYAVSYRLSAFRFVTKIGLRYILSEQILSVFTVKGLQFFRDSLPKYFTWPVLLMALLGLLLCFNKSRRFLAAWALAFAAECAVVLAPIRFSYYLIVIAPILSVLCAVAAGELWRWKKQTAAGLAALTVLFTAYSGLRLRKESFVPDRLITEAGALIGSVAGYDDVVVIGAMDPSYLNAADRRGYRANLSYYPYIPQGPAAELAYFLDHGADWFAVVGGQIYCDDGSYLTYLKAHYPLYAENDACAVYKLR
jgi:4-amino-4-deoxy-L-arabinose transferase-like glycosyltransferase